MLDNLGSRKLSWDMCCATELPRGFGGTWVQALVCGRRRVAHVRVHGWAGGVTFWHLSGIFSDMCFCYIFVLSAFVLARAVGILRSLGMRGGGLGWAT